MKLKKVFLALAFTPIWACAADVVEFKAVAGDFANCPVGYDAATPIAVINYRDFACRAIGSQGGARLSDKAAMSGASGGCSVYSFPVDKAVPVTLCMQVRFQEIAGEVKPGGPVQCPSGTRLASAAEAVIFNRQACGALSGAYNIVRLSGEASLGGKDYGCRVNQRDTEGKGQSLCVAQ